MKRNAKKKRGIEQRNQRTENTPPSTPLPTTLMLAHAFSHRRRTVDGDRTIFDFVGLSVEISGRCEGSVEMKGKGSAFDYGGSGLGRTVYNAGDSTQIPNVERDECLEAEPCGVNELDDVWGEGAWRTRAGRRGAAGEREKARKRDGQGNKRHTSNDRDPQRLRVGMQRLRQIRVPVIHSRSYSLVHPSLFLLRSRVSVSSSGHVTACGQGKPGSQLKNQAQNSTLSVEEAQCSCPCMKVRKRASDGDLRCHDVSILARRGPISRFGSFLDLLPVRVELLDVWFECEYLKASKKMSHSWTVFVVILVFTMTQGLYWNACILLYSSIWVYSAAAPDPSTSATRDVLRSGAAAEWTPGWKGGTNLEGGQKEKRRRNDGENKFRVNEPRKKIE
ncbi:hypothetical protein B0H13DRAFT_1930252 [Mycena leptocephala]|nr:hypothetical protein B0H13DRAFT_1930252 [Mycena leptocephala]